MRSHMKSFKIKTSTLAGRITAPPSKSHSMRAILFASMASGESIITNCLASPDVDAMISACQQLGAVIKRDDNTLVITGVAGKPSLPDDVIDAGNSGQVLRFVAAISALIDGHVIFTGDHSVRHNRPIQPLLDGLSQLGATCISTKNDGHAPAIIKGPIHAGEVTIHGQDSQPVSGLLIAAAFLEGKTVINVTHPGETPWIGLTLSWFDRLGIEYQNNNFEKYIVHCNSVIDSFNYTVPGDFSSIAFPLVAALITHSEITIDNVDMSDAQGDKKIIDVLVRMGANIEIDNRTLIVKPNGVLQGANIDVNDFIDAVTILAVVGCFAEGTTVLNNAGIARKKECDRLSAITSELKKMGADITETEDALIINRSTLSGAQCRSYHDHRIAMSTAVAGFAANSESLINNIACVQKSYPNFVDDMSALGCNIEVIS